MDVLDETYSITKYKLKPETEIAYPLKNDKCNTSQ